MYNCRIANSPPAEVCALCASAKYCAPSDLCNIDASTAACFKQMCAFSRCSAQQSTYLSLRSLAASSIYNKANMCHCLEEVESKLKTGNHSTTGLCAQSGRRCNSSTTLCPLLQSQAVSQCRPLCAPSCESAHWRHVCCSTSFYDSIFSSPVVNRIWVQPKVEKRVQV